jgi:lysophospholipase L1-like esterase
MPRQPAPASVPLSDHAGPASRQRRRLLRGASALAAGLAFAPGASLQALAAENWTATWGTAPAGPPTSASALTFSNQTLRLIAHTSIGGNRLRVRLSNEMGSTPLTIGAAWVGITSTYASLVAGSNRQLTFGGRTAITIAPGAPMLSDPVDLAVPAQSDLAVSLYLPGSVVASTVHDAACQTNYVSSAGNYASTAALPIAAGLYSWPFLTEIDMAVAGASLVALGDSQTDGALSVGNANHRWTDYLARRLQLEAPALTVGVVNRGLSGNRLLGDAANTPLAGKDALERFDRDVLSTAGVHWLAVQLGINDIVFAASSDLPAIQDEIALGYRQLIARARTRGIQTLGATLPPFEGFVYYAPARETARQLVNSWIRTSGAFDAVLDFDAAVRDPAQPGRLLAAYDGGDHLHPNDAGFDAIAKSIPLGIFAAG